MKWEPMETAPRNQGILQFGLDCDGRGGYWDAIGVKKYDPFYKKWTDGVAYPSHWMPLPAPPIDTTPEILNAPS